MAKKLEKLCESDSLIVGKRYSLSSKNLIDKYIFIVNNIKNDYIHITYLDGEKGAMPLKNRCTVFEFPFSSLEKELL